MSLGLSILSWRGAETLRKSLASYIEEDLFSLCDDAQIFLPDPDEAVLNITNKSPAKVKTHPENCGIMENMRLAALNMSTDYILMLENDCPLIETHQEAAKQLNSAMRILQHEDVIMARFRSVKEPGQAFPGLRKYQRLFDGSFKSNVTKLFRPSKVRRLTGYALYDGQSSIERHPNVIESIGDGFHLVDASVMPWTNQSILIRRDIFLNKIIPMAEQIHTRRGANHLPNLEVELNKLPDWRHSGWKIACGAGLFTHERIGERGYD